LVQFDGVGTNSDDRVIVMGATNRPQELDEAARRRLVKRIYVPLPEKETRLGMINKLLGSQNHSLTSKELNWLADQTETYSGSDLTALCKDAALGPLRELGSLVREISPSKVRPINVKDFQASLTQIRSSVSLQSLQAFEQWNKEYGSASL